MRRLLVPLLLIAAPAPAQDVPLPAALDELLARRDYAQLATVVLSPPSVAAVDQELNWLRDRMIAGETSFVAMLYARLLWESAERLPPAAPEGLRDNAAMVTLYAYGSILVDGERCGDRTAPSHRLEQLIAWNMAIWPYLAALPAQRREKVLRTAALVDARTAPRRLVAGDVDFVCRDGMDEMTYNLRHGTVREAPLAPGRPGRTVVATGDGKYRPAVLPDAVWRPRAEATRATLPATLAAMATGRPPTP